MPVNDTPDEFSLKVGARMKQLRKAMGFKNYEMFAFEKKINRTQYGRYENGRDIKLSTLNKIVKAFGIDVKEFFSEGFD